LPDQSLLQSFPVSHTRSPSALTVAQRHPSLKFVRPSTAPSTPSSELRLEDLQSDVSPIGSSKRSHVQALDPPSPQDGHHDQNSWPRGKHHSLRPRSASADSNPPYGVQSSRIGALIPPVPPKPTDTDTFDDASKKKGLLRGILNRR
jgi:hypothetical protein